MTLTYAQCKLLTERGLKPPENPVGEWFWVKDKEEPQLCLRWEHDPFGYGYDYKTSFWNPRYNSEVFAYIEDGADSVLYHPTVETLKKLVGQIYRRKHGSKFREVSTGYYDKEVGWHKDKQCFVKIRYPWGHSPKDMATQIEIEYADSELLALYRLIMQITKEKGKT